MNMLKTNKISEVKEINKAIADDLISIQVHVRIVNDVNDVNEIIDMKFGKSATVKEILKEIVSNVNSNFESKKISLKFKPDGLNYDLERYDENGEIKEKFQRRKKLSDINCTEFNLVYSPQDIMINFRENKSLCTGCIIF